MAKTPVISLRNVSKGWAASKRHIDILRDLSLDVYLGESLAIVGPSGAGKSTLLHILGLLTPPDSGSLTVAGVEMDRCNLRRSTSLRHQIGLVFQDAKLLHNLNVMGNVQLPLMHRGVPLTRQKKMALDALEKVGLLHRLKHKPNQLSGGEMMRVALARALVYQPIVLLADEPTGTLDSANGARVAELLFKVLAQDRALVLVTHQMDLAHQADRIIRIADGRIDEAGHDQPTC